MPPPNEKMATSLEALRALGPTRAIPASALTRVHRERLKAAGYLGEVVKGWYVATQPGDSLANGTAWSGAMREFIADYCNDRFGEEWHVGPEQSLRMHSGERSLPLQLSIWSPAARNQTLDLPQGASVFLYKSPRLFASQASKDAGGLRLVKLESTLVAASPTFFAQHQLAATIALCSLDDASDLTRTLLKGSHSVVAGRLAGALRAVGRPEMAEEIVRTMRSAGYKVLETNHFKAPVNKFPRTRHETPAVQRVRLMWADMRQTIIDTLPASGPLPGDAARVLEDVEARYVSDAYHSLSIEGYRVTQELIENARQVAWKPAGGGEALRDASAVRGYCGAHKAAMQSIEAIVNGQNPGEELRASHGAWHRALLSPSVEAGFTRPRDLAGYRDDQVFIQGAQYIPLSKEAVRVAMPVLFDLIAEEEHPAAKAVLGHFLFEFIHPYMDGNGRLGRLLMNTLLVSSGYPWTTVPLEQRQTYMDALAQASTHSNILPLAQLIGRLLEEQRKHPPEGPANRQ